MITKNKLAHNKRYYLLAAKDVNIHLSEIHSYGKISKQE